jgi:predicted GNAT family acetyltransferase
MAPDIKHNPEHHRFEAAVDGHVAELTYRRNGDRITLIHVGVPPELRNRGLGGALAKAALDYAAENQLKVIPLCPFVAAYIHNNSQYQQLL